MMWTEKLKTMGSWALSNESEGVGKVDERVIVMDVSNINLGKGMTKTPSKTPV